MRESAAAVDFFFRETNGGKTSESQKLEKPAFQTPVGEYEPLRKQPNFLTVLFLFKVLVCTTLQ